MNEPAIGAAYRGRDGVVRWVTGKSRRGYFHLLWLSEEEQVWYSGGSVKADRWVQGGYADQGEVPAPKSGEAYTLCGPMGTRYQRTAAE